MLPADVAHRLVSLFTQALEDSAEEKRRLHQSLSWHKALLGDWQVGEGNEWQPMPRVLDKNPQVPESPDLKDGENDIQDSEPSAKECEELELLNKALEKALRIRSKFHQAPCEATEGEKAAAKKPVISDTLKQQLNNSKESISKTAKVSSVIRKAVPSKKPTAYMLKAPYRTDPDGRRPQAKMLPQQSSRVAKVPEKKRSARGAASPKAKLPIKISRAGHEKVFAAGEPGTPPDSSKSPHLAKQRPSSGNSADGSDFAGPDPPLPEAGNKEPAVESLVSQNRLRGSIPGMGLTSRTSTLQEKGSSLKLPLPYRKAFSRLLEKCQLCQTSPDAALAKARFMEKLQATFCSPSPAFSPAEVRKELMHLHDVHILVSQHMEAETSAFLGENPTWERQYESLLTLEGLQAVVDQSLAKVDQLREAMESYSKLLAPPSACSQKCSCACCASLGRQRCWDIETVGPPPLLFYSSLKELEDMEVLKLKVAMLHKQLEIQKVMEAELLPLLEPGIVQEGSTASLFRAVYTLLCEGGVRFPVLVRDEEPPS
ncbi:tubulin epsilon and delta complex protein 2 isoform X2 [Varanus komodoensis]|uniref:tubulin epsilon and delta complex protein 2 isoform X2 n=1 Tax=Varanus komodoensis TaxID=61221 RepID=UPI001CF771F5|nr:tubulin epsilon and delta complex protein 2 isoform X2 [Varanus komodoensis]